MADNGATIQARFAEQIKIRGRRGGRPLFALLAFARRKPLGFAGLFIIVLFTASGLAAPAIAPYDYATQNFSERLQGPSWQHLFGTDHLGRDLFSRIIYGARVTIGVGFGAVALSQAIAVMVALTGYWGGLLDSVVQRLLDIWLSFPALVLALTILSVTGSGFVPLLLTVAVLTAAASSRLFRSAFLVLRAAIYVEAARAIGATDARILARHILPNCVPLIIWSATVTLGVAVQLEASLGFLGYGIPPPAPEWGQMLSGAGLQFMRRAPWLAVWPGLAITAVVFAFNVLGDALRDVLDPRLRHG